MKNLIILLAIFSVQSCINVRINSTDNINKVFSNVKNPNISATGTFFNFTIKDDTWSNENTFNSTRAKFKNAVGESYIKLKVKNQTTVHFHHLIKVDGYIKLEIINPIDEVVYTKEFTKNEEGSFILYLKKGEYMVKWTAKNADGNYYLEWKES